MSVHVLREERQRRALVDFVMKLDIGKVWQITIERYARKRSLSANSLYWKWVGLIAKETGNDASDIHDYLKRRFLTPIEITIGDETVEVYTTTKLSVEKMSEYMTQVEAFANSTLGVYLPHPEDRHLEAA